MSVELSFIESSLEPPLEEERKAPEIPPQKLFVPITSKPIEPSRVSLRPQSERWVFEGDLLARGQIGGINGIATTKDLAKQNGKYLFELAESSQLEWVYNATHSPILDICETVFIHSFHLSYPATLLYKNWVAFDQKHKENPEAKYLQICHSQGASHVKSALLGAPLSLRDRIIVIAIAPAAIIPNDLCFESFNYASLQDPTPYSEALMDSTLSPQRLEKSKEALNELVLLPAHPDAPLLDHQFQSPTFASILKAHLKNYSLTYGGDSC